MQVKTLNKYKNKTVLQLLTIAQRWFNKWIKIRDCPYGDYINCISCGKVTPVKESHASHFYSAGHYSALRFHEDNVHASCIRCNTYMHGNLNEYRKRLVQKIGPERLEYLDNFCRGSNKWDKVALIEVIETYKAKCKATP